MPILNVNLNINEVSRDVKLNPFVAEGGITASFVSGGVNYISHTFYSSSGTTAPQTFRILNGETVAQVLVVGGGAIGQSGLATATGGNGGGAGGVNYTASYELKQNPQGPDTYTIIVGKGGTNVGFTPETSSFTPAFIFEQAGIVTAYTGGSGSSAGQSGASGGGGTTSSGSAIYGDQGFDGGLATGNSRGGSGGGGAAQKGFNNSAQNGGDGGDGKAFTLQDGTTKYYGGGGGGGHFNDVAGTAGTGGLGGGGNGGTGDGVQGGSGVEGTGGAGGGGNTNADAGACGPGGNGGSGIVIITYPVA